MNKKNIFLIFFSMLIISLLVGLGAFGGYYYSEKRLARIVFSRMEGKTLGNILSNDDYKNFAKAYLDYNEAVNSLILTS